MFKRISKMGRDRDMPTLTGTTAVAVAAAAVPAKKSLFDAE
jgi:hypothetical protein